MTDDRPLVSIVTPSLNQARYLPEALASVRAQTYAPVEHIVVDGGSTDGTDEILRASDGLRWVSEPDGGQSEALNKGFAIARRQRLRLAERRRPLPAGRGRRGRRGARAHRRRARLRRRHAGERRRREPAADPLAPPVRPLDGAERGLRHLLAVRLLHPRGLRGGRRGRREPAPDDGLRPLAADRAAGPSSASTRSGPCSASTTTRRRSRSRTRSGRSGSGSAGGTAGGSISPLLINRHVKSPSIRSLVRRAAAPGTRRSAERPRRARLMCGLCGVVAAGRPPEREAVERMLDELGHRGPDGRGVFAEDGVCLGHLRLAIIDLSDAGPAAVRERRRPAAAAPQRRDLQLPRAARRAACRGPRLPHRDGHGGAARRLPRVGRALRRAPERHVGVRDLGRWSGGGSSPRATASASSRSTTGWTATGSRSRARRRPCAARRRVRTSSSSASTSSRDGSTTATGRSSRACAGCRRRTTSSSTRAACGSPATGGSSRTTPRRPGRGGPRALPRRRPAAAPQRRAGRARRSPAGWTRPRSRSRSPPRRRAAEDRSRPTSTTRPSTSGRYARAVVERDGSRRALGVVRRGRPGREPARDRSRPGGAVRLDVDLRRLVRDARGLPGRADRDAGRPGRRRALRRLPRRLRLPARRPARGRPRRRSSRASSARSGRSSARARSPPWARSRGRSCRRALGERGARAAEGVGRARAPGAAARLRRRRRRTGTPSPTGCDGISRRRSAAAACRSCSATRTATRWRTRSRRGCRSSTTAWSSSPTRSTAAELIARGETKAVLRRALADLLPPPVRDRRGQARLRDAGGRVHAGRARRAWRAESFGSPALPRARASSTRSAALRRLERHRRGELSAGMELWRALNLELWARSFLDA